MAQPNRVDIQKRIDSIRRIFPELDMDGLKVQIKTWLDTLDLSYGNLSHSFIRDRIIEDLNSYQLGEIA